MKAKIIDGVAVAMARELNSTVLLPNGHVGLFPAAAWKCLHPDTVRVWGHLNARYGIPTVETIGWLLEQIGGRSAIEIGAGHGDFAYHLGIPATDSCVQETPEMKSFYSLTGQPTISYPKEVERLDALQAVAKYQPQVVIASWVTQLFVPGKDIEEDAQAFVYGVDEIAILETPCVETYIVIGNMNIHGRKRARRRKHEVLQPYGLVSRAAEPEKNCVFIWNK